MSEVNADGVLLNPHEAILQQVQALSNTLMAETPQGMEDDQEHTVFAGNGEAAGTVGGAPHIPPETAAPPGRRRGGGERQLRRRPSGRSRPKDGAAPERQKGEPKRRPSQGSGG